MNLFGRRNTVLRCLLSALMFGSYLLFSALGSEELSAPENGSLALYAGYYTFPVGLFLGLCVYCLGKWQGLLVVVPLGAVFILIYLAATFLGTAPPRIPSLTPRLICFGLFVASYVGLIVLQFAGSSSSD